MAPNKSKTVSSPFRWKTKNKTNHKQKSLHTDRKAQQWNQGKTRDICIRLNGILSADKYQFFTHSMPEQLWAWYYSTQEQGKGSSSFLTHCNIQDLQLDHILSSRFLLFSCLHSDHQHPHAPRMIEVVLPSVVCH